MSYELESGGGPRGFSYIESAQWPPVPFVGNKAILSTTKSASGPKEELRASRLAEKSVNRKGGAFLELPRVSTARDILTAYYATQPFPRRNAMYRVPLFSTYRQRENQVSHALAVTFERCPTFRRILLERIADAAGGTKASPELRAVCKRHRAALVATQCHFGLSAVLESPEEAAQKSIPDIVFEFPGREGGTDAHAPCIVVEAKVTAPWELEQAVRHTTFVKRQLDFVLGLAVTAQDTEDLLANNKLPQGWISFPWTQVYTAAITAGTDQARELCRVLEITEAKLMDDKTLPGTLTAFGGIDFRDESDYSPVRARRMARLLAKELSGLSDLKKLGVTVPDPKSISSSSGKDVWVEANTLPCFQGLSSSVKTPHLNFTVASGHFGCGLTFPNASFRGTLRSGLRNLPDQDALSSEISRILRALEQLERLGAEYRPRWYLAQNYYTSQRARPRQDGIINFDLRAVVSSPGKKQKSFTIKNNQVWLQSIINLITESHNSAHVQSGIGVDFPYTELNRAFLSNGQAVAQATALVWEALLPLAKLMGYTKN